MPPTQHAQKATPKLDAGPPAAEPYAPEQENAPQVPPASDARQRRAERIASGDAAPALGSDDAETDEQYAARVSAAREEWAAGRTLENDHGAALRALAQHTPWHGDADGQNTVLQLAADLDPPFVAPERN